MGSDQKWDWVSVISCKYVCAGDKRHGAGEVVMLLCMIQSRETERKESKPNLLRIGINMTLASPKTAAFLFAPFCPRSVFFRERPNQPTAASHQGPRAMLVLLVPVSLRSPLVCSLLSLTKSGCWGTGRCPPPPSAFGRQARTRI